MTERDYLEQAPFSLVIPPRTKMTSKELNSKNPLGYPAALVKTQTTMKSKTSINNQGS